MPRTERLSRARIGIIGAGSWAVANHLPVLKRRKDVELVGVARPGREALLRIQAAFGIPDAFETHGELLAAVPMDGVVIASPHHLHAEQAIAALEKGCHVMVEKPMATNVADARRVAATARKQGRHVLVPYGWSFQPYFRAARDMVQSGRIGRIRHVVAQMATPIEDLMSGGELQGTEKEMFRPESATWTHTGSGGYGWGQLVHMLGGLFYVSELEPESVYALVGQSEIGTDIHNALAMTFAGGVTGSLSGAASVPPGSPFQVDIRLFGTEGMLLLDVERERLWLRRRDGRDEDVPIEPGQGAYTCTTPVERFVDLCLGRDVENCGDASMGIRSVQVVEAMLRSARSRSPVMVD
ncbi:Gfo/Idh/MocA family protein [Labrys monachus]|uniref:Dehydrogenase n=1 Tax=Labrys monachus TaxID=217067 RepID=A0ABU0FF57_9HYPH|nr:Gfo/Idh/MocA family oxidoreductase [Labrys monachus]MDQ0393091.1 putative dehydrogenase [Labrys monachus]